MFSVGCSSHRYDVADPVVGPPPPRRQGFDAIAYEENQAEESQLQLTSFSPDEPIPMTEVVARVNGTPILAGLVLEPYAGKLAEASGKLPPSEIRKAQEMLLKKNLPAQIEQTLMVDAVKSKLEQEQLDQINVQLDVFFEQEIDRLKSQFKVSNTAELEGLLQSKGMSLVTMREMFGNRQLATEYVRGKIGSEAPLSRKNLLAEYNRTIEEYAQPEQVRWQQIQVSVAKHGSKTAAQKVIAQATAELQTGAEFSDVVKRYSDGPLKDNGGHWDWTQPSSIASEEVRETLATLQTGQVSGALTDGNSLKVVKVTGRKPATYTPFEEVQEKIREQLLTQEREAHAKQVVAELKENAIIETMFDDSFDSPKSVIR